MCHPASPINQGILYLEKDNNVSRETLLRNESYNIGLYINIDEVTLQGRPLVFPETGLNHTRV